MDVSLPTFVRRVVFSSGHVTCYNVGSIVPSQIMPNTIEFLLLIQPYVYGVILNAHYG